MGPLLCIGLAGALKSNNGRASQLLKVSAAPHPQNQFYRDIIDLKNTAFIYFEPISMCLKYMYKWNALPDDIVKSKTVLQFKTLYDRHMGFSKFITKAIY